MPKPNPPAKTLHKHLRLQHSAHTGRLLHHRHTSYRGLALLLFVAGACMLGLNWMARATADTITVYAAIYATIPTDPPIITSPDDGSTSEKSTIAVSGTCPASDNQIVIQLLVDGTPYGSTPCDSSGDFSLTVALTPGDHSLVARAWTITGQPGMDSAPVHVIYTQPAPITSSAQALAEEDHSGTPLMLTEDSPFVVFGPEKDGVWSGSITGGRAPYHVRINWGDGSSSNYTVQKSGHGEFSHHYTNMDSHIITLRVTDADGRGVMRDYAAVTPYLRPTPIFVGTTPPNHYKGSVITGMYGVYLMAIAGVGFAWIIAHRTNTFSYATVSATHPPRRTGVSKRKHSR